jgi:hypothetical protein
MINNVWLAECDFCGRIGRVSEQDILAHPLKIAHDKFLKAKVRAIFEERGWHVEETGNCICGNCMFMRQAFKDNKAAV